MTSATGGTLGQHLSRILGDTIIHASAQTADHKAAASRRAVDGWLEEAEEAYRPILSDLFGTLMERDDLPPGWRQMLETMTGPSHQFDILLQFLGFVGALLVGIPTLGRIEIQSLVNQLYTDYTHVPLSPADLADMVERNIISEGAGADEAAMSGVNGDRFHKMVLDTGEPPGIDQMLSLWRRGLLDEGTLRKMIAYSRIRTEWTDHVIALAHDTMSPGDAIEGTLKGVLDSGTGQGYFERAGGMSDQFQSLLEMAGNPIGVEQALRLYNHGMISDGQVSAVIRHSRINPQFEQMALLLRHQYLSAFQIDSAVKSGAATAQQAIEWLLAEGYPADQVTAVVQGAASGKVAVHKALTEAQIAPLYETGVINHDQASARLVALGYEKGEVDLILALYDEKRHLSMVQAAVNQVRKVFLAGRIDGPRASTMLDGLGIDHQARDTFIETWTVEQQSELRELTAAQIGSAYKKGLLADAGAEARWAQMGYSADDAAMLLAIYGGPPPAGSPAAQAPAAPTGV